MTDDKDIHSESLSSFRGSSFPWVDSLDLRQSGESSLSMTSSFKSGPVNDLNGLSDWEPVEENFSKKPLTSK